MKISGSAINRGGRNSPKAMKMGSEVPNIVIGRITDRSSEYMANRLAMKRNAGMMLDSVLTNASTAQFGVSTFGDAYRNSYANGALRPSGASDVPIYFQMMNMQNGGILYYPVKLSEKYEWFRYWARSDAYIGRGLELLSDLPLSKISLNMPKMEGQPELRKEIHDFYLHMVDHLNLFDKLQSLLWEYNCLGNVFLFHEWDEQKKMWDKIIFLPPEEVAIFQYPFSNDSWAEYFPQRIIKLVQTSVASGTEGMSEMEEGIVNRIPAEIKKMILETGKIVLDTDPMSGSFLHHIARRKSPYQDLGSSVLDRVLVPMLHKEHMKYTQLSILTRNMTPTNLIYAENVNQDALDDLRAQVDLRMMDPDYNIVTNYVVNWEQIGAENRLLDLGREYETIENQIFAAMGVTRELLTGEGTYSGTRITIEILNTMFLLTREVLQNYIEKCLFKPVAEAHGWFIKDKNGAKKYLYPKVGFNRLTIRDNAEVFDSLFQLYQKGSLPIDVIYELLNLNTSDLHERIYEDLFTVKDPNFNRLVDGLLTEAGRQIPTSTDIIDKVIKYLNLKKQEEQPEDGMGGDMGGAPPANEFDMSDLMGEQPPPEAAAGATDGEAGVGFGGEENGQEPAENGSGILAENLVVKVPKENVDKKDSNNGIPPKTENLVVKDGTQEVKSQNLAVKGEVKSENLVVKSDKSTVKNNLPLPKNLAVKTKKVPLSGDLAVVIKQDDIESKNLVVKDKNGSMA